MIFGQYLDNTYFAQCYFPENVFCCFCKDGVRISFLPSHPLSCFLIKYTVPSRIRMLQPLLEKWPILPKPTHPPAAQAPKTKKNSPPRSSSCPRRFSNRSQSHRTLGPTEWATTTTRCPLFYLRFFCHRRRW